MPRKSGDELRDELQRAESRIKVGGIYRHYKDISHRYTVTGLAVIEALDEIGVLYRAEYPECEGMTFIRPIDEFLAPTGADGFGQHRFTESEA